MVVAVLVGSGGTLYLRNSLPQTQGVVKIAGLQGAVEIIRDVDGIPHIFAATRAEALFGLGYVHAQDRLWQMEFQRRVGQGRLSELFGSSTVSTDRFLRTLGPYRAAQSAWQRLNPETKVLIEAYTGGINAFVAGRSGNQLPPEFTLLRVAPKPWTGPDVLVWAKMMAWDLSGNYPTELLRSNLLQSVDEQDLQMLLPGYPEDGLSALQTEPAPAGYDRLLALGEQVRRDTGVGAANGLGLGSNNWVVDATKSTTSAPLLANDPHLGARLPSTWYLAHMVADDLDVIGATIPGLPAVVIGRNRFISWGVTNFGPDVQDLFRERLSPDGQQAEFMGQLEPMQLITETIEVRDAAPVQQLVHITRHGPLISDALNQNALESLPDEREPSLEPLALRWVALEPEDETISAFLGIDRARSWDDFRAALRLYVAPAQNFVYADVEGNIGQYGPGRVPIRADGDGSRPVEGWSGRYEWTGWIPFDDLPSVYNPAEHMIVTANNRTIPADYPYFLARDWAEPYRAQRIKELLRARPQHSPADFAAMQADSTSVLARELLPSLLASVSPEDERMGAALAKLSQWNYETTEDSAATAIFQSWYLRLPRAVAEDELGPNLIDTYEGWFSFASRFVTNTFKARAHPWCDDRRTDQREDCAAIAQTTLQAALDDLQTRLGPDMERWRWGELHQVVFGHQPLDTIGPLQRIVSRRVPHGGDGSTINVGPFAFDRPFEQRVVAGYRHIIDMSRLDGGQFIHAIGQSGHPLSPHYDHYLDDWRAGRYRPMRIERATIEQASAGTLRLEP